MSDHRTCSSIVNRLCIGADSIGDPRATLLTLESKVLLGCADYGEMGVSNNFLSPQSGKHIKVDIERLEA